MRTNSINYRKKQSHSGECRIYYQDKVVWQFRYKTVADRKKKLPAKLATMKNLKDPVYVIISPDIISKKIF